MNFSSNLVKDAVEAFASLPGIGRKSALRLVLHLLQQPPETTTEFAEAISKMRAGIKTCQRCGNLSDAEICGICQDPARDGSIICVVKGVRDLMAIEDTQHFRGRYHVLGGLIAPIEGIGPADLTISDLIHRAQQPETEELIMALSPTIDGDTTIFYINKQLSEQGIDVTVSNIARGVSFGGELEYADGVTLGRSILARTPYKG
ncbi:MAG: recombination mediator RecR [Bacteroidota bacterium]